VPLIYGMGHNAYSGVNLLRLFFPEAQEPPRAISAPSPAPLRAAPGGEQRGVAVPAR